ncbi:MAG: hypothetical protein AAGJ18_14440 [Bacteroidota bacterium]
MMKDIPNLKVRDLAIAIVPREDEEELWDVYIINFKNEPIGSVFINSRGYGELDGEKTRTTTLRHFFEQIAANHLEQIEPIQMELFELTNEYWVSFMHDGHMYDKKYVFVKGSIDAMNFTTIPHLERKGVMIK